MAVRLELQDRNHALLIGRVDDLQMEMRSEFAYMRGEFAELRGEFAQLRGEFAQLRGEFAQMRAQLAGINLFLQNLSDGLMTTFTHSDLRFQKLETRVDRLESSN